MTLSYYVGYEEGYEMAQKDVEAGKPRRSLKTFDSNDVFDVGVKDGYGNGYEFFYNQKELKEAGRRDAKRDFEEGRGINIPESLKGSSYERSYRISYGIRKKKSEKQ